MQVEEIPAKLECVWYFSKKICSDFVPKFEDSGSALDNFKGVAGHKQQELMKPIYMWRTYFKDVQGTQVFLPNNIIQFLGPSQTLKNCL